MSKNIPLLLLDHYRSGARTTCFLLRIEPKDSERYPTYGVTTLDTDVEYDGLTYYAAIGAELSDIVSPSNLDVTNSEARSLMPKYEVPIDEADIVAGAYDFAKFKLMRVNYNDLSMGHETVQTGTLGRVLIDANGLSTVTELRGLAQALKQTITEKWSLGCRATPASKPIGTVTSETVERYPCNWDRDSLWESGTVDAPGVESTSIFTTSGLSPAFGGAPGTLRWTSGKNAGRTYEVERFTDAAGVQTLELSFTNGMFPVEAGDEYDFVDSCPGTPEACKARDNWQWYRGEPNIPVPDAGQISVPGASAGVGTGASVNQEFNDAIV